MRRRFREGLSKAAGIGIIVIIIIAAIAGYLYMQSQGPAQTTTSPETGTSPTTTATATGTTTTTTKPVKVLVLFDVGGRGDLSFNDMAWLGAERAKKELGVEVQYQTPPSQADMKPLLEQVSQSGEYDLIVLVGFLWTSVLNETADEYPNQKYALIDSTTGVQRPNEVDILFREQEVAALIGVLASGIAEKLGGDKVAALAGMDIPPLWKFHIGYLFGIQYWNKKTNSNVQLLWVYTGTFTDPNVGKEQTLQLLQQGAKVVYGLAGLTHLGAFDAVKEWAQEHNETVFAIGQDASQEWIDPYHIILSGAKRVDVAVYTAIKMVVENKWQSGIITLGIKEGGVGIWDLDGVREFAQLAAEQGKLPEGMTPDKVVQIVQEMRNEYIPQQAWDLANQLEQMLKNGEISFKTPLSHDEYDSIINALQNGDLNAALASGHVDP